MPDLSSLRLLGLDPFSFRPVAASESDADPSFDPTATRVHEDGEPCSCPCECVEYVDAWYAEHEAHRFPH